MSDFSYFFAEPCELVAIVYQSDGITELGSYSFRGYMKGMDYFFQVCSLLAYEVANSYRFGTYERDSDFELYLDTLRSYYHDVKNGEADSLESAIRQRIEELKQYKFVARKVIPFLPDSGATTSAARREIEITVDRVFKRILKMRQHRIIFYERVLKEYTARKDQYNRSLRTYLESSGKDTPSELNNFSLDLVLSKFDLDPFNHNRELQSEESYEIHNHSWYLKDLMKLDNPEIERYTKSFEELPRYRTGSVYTHPEGLKAFFELFSVFKDEMSLILPENPQESFFDRVLTILVRDFVDDFKQRGDLEVIIIGYIENLEKYEFLSLSKEAFFDKLSKMIYSLRARRIKYYEAVLEDYLANKEKYDKNMEIKTLKYIR